MCMTHALVLHQGNNSGDDRKGNQSDKSRSVVSLKEFDDVPPIDRAQTRYDEETYASPESQSSQKFVTGILQRAGGEQKGNDRERRRQNCGNRNRPETPAFKSSVYILGFCLRQSFLERLSATFLGEPVRQIS